MRIILKSKVNGYYKTVMSRFDRALFEYLKPPIGRVEVLSFTGSKKGDTVHLNLYTPFKMEWVSIITEDGSDEENIYFIDEGQKLPFPLKRWRHRHVVKRLSEHESEIVDDMEYSTGLWLIDLIMYPVFYATFYPRKKQYREYFRQVLDE